MNCAYGNTRLARFLVRLCAVGNVLAFFLMCEASSAVSGPGTAGWLLFGAALVVGNVVTGIYALQQGLVFEWLRERQWAAVCKGIGGNFVGEGRAKFQPNPLWAVGGSAGKVVRQVKYPKLRDIRGTRDSFTGIVYPFAGQNVDDYIQMADRFALSFKVPCVVFDLDEHGLIRIRAGRAPVPVAFEFEE